MNDKSDAPKGIPDRPKITTDERGRTVWTEPVEAANLELVSTQTLKQIIEADDRTTNDQLREVAEGQDGLLARDVDAGRFEIVNEAELQRALASTDTDPSVDGDTNKALAVADTDELELVDTQMLRTLLSPEDADQTVAGESAEAGFDPYDNTST